MLTLSFNTQNMKLAGLKNTVLSFHKLIYCLSCLILLQGCQSEKDKLFTKLPASETGLNFINQLHENEAFNIVEYLYYYNGGGVAVGDVNNDNLPDIFLTANQGENKLYLNRGNFKFEDITKKAGVGRQSRCVGMVNRGNNGRCKP